MGLAGQYQVIPSSFEEHLDDNRSPEEVAEELGYGKALWVAEHHPGAWVIGSDTIVTIDGKQLAKPRDEQEARYMLTLLAGRTNYVTTSVALVCLQGMTADEERIVKHYIGHETGRVVFKPYDQMALDAYIATGDWRDKAAAYGIQSGAHVLIDHFEGNFDAIVGLPTHLLADFLAEAGFKASPVELQAPVPRK